MWELVAGCADGELVSAAHVCQAAVVAVEVDGAALSVATRPDRRQRAHATDAVAALLEEQQFTLGEGPSIEAGASGGQVLVADVSSPACASRWPMFAPVATAAGAWAVFAFPLQVGAIRLGTLTLYRARPGSLSGEQVADAVTLCRTAVAVMLAAGQTTPNGAASDQGAWPLGGPGEGRIEVYQATGMVAVQLGVGLQDAFAVLRARAFTEGVPLARLARRVVDRRLRFHPGDFPDG
ncbi:ANTAR domain-containing protein [Actinomadura sp. KC216]|uniref:GAF and ANTAR domain-containing protein n=1 Tax=Actinomadura sp. KC216 TaxID=2530370 RepID=UPI00104D3117|nr:GAF and ANTAR domain-containing protein [Actinomadura sp. KC216]TDB90601.1 ANTAR domain-containing protein [Actinomadura sp. KC216]